MTTTTKSSSEYILDISKEYSIYVCSSRAIPFVADGLKDVQRKALWLTQLQILLPKVQQAKQDCANKSWAWLNIKF